MRSDASRDPGDSGPGRAGVGRRLRVLVVDDEEAIRVTIRIVLERRGHTVVQAGTAQEGLDRALEAMPDVALVDLRLPGNGLTLLRQLEAMPELAGRTALVTGSEDLLMDERGNPVWPRWLAKPFDFDELVALVERLGR